MPRATGTKTKYPGIYARETYSRDRKRGITVYDIRWRDENAKPRVETFHGRLEDAQKRRIQILAERDSGGVSDGTRVTLADFGRNVWLRDVKARAARGELRSYTVTHYERDFENHIVPALGSLKLAQINNASQIDALRDRLLDGGKAPDTVRRIITTLGYCLRFARKRRLINYNPVEDASKPSARRRKPDLPTLAQVWKLADAMPTRTARNLTLFAAFTGLRLAELFGLRWESVDLTEGAERIVVREQYVDGEHVNQAKTRAGNREVLLTPEAAGVLNDQWLDQQAGNRANPRGLVFPSPEGYPWRKQNWYRRVWIPVAKTAGLDGMKFHTLRSLYVTTIRSTNLPLSFTEQLTGHVDDRTHRDYTRPLPGTEQLIRDAQAGLFARPTEDEA